MHRTDSGADGGTVRELHVVALSEDGRHVVLATRPGTASGDFRVALDERLTAAVRGELPSPGRDAAPSISPRDIQARLRDGEAPEDIAASAGVPLSRVERYAGPVLAELDRMITGARAAVVSRPRLGASALPLGEAVAAHLAEVAHLAEGSVRWSARRTDLGRWVVEVHWTARGRRRTAGWHYDPATREAVAVDGPSAILGHVEAEAAPAPAAARSARPAAAAPTARGARATGAARPAAAAPAVRTPAAPASASPRTSSGPSPRAARPSTAGATARTSDQPASSPHATGSPTSPATRRRAVAPPAAPMAAAAAPATRRRAPAPQAPAAAAPAARRRSTPAAGPAPAASAPPRRAPAAGAPVEQRPVRRAAASSQPAPRRATSRRSAVPSLEELATAPTTETPASDAETVAAPTSAGAAAPAGTPSAPPSGPPVLRVVPPAAPEPVTDADDAPPAPEAQPVRRAVGQRAGGRDWADVLMGSAPAGEPRQD